MVGTNFQSGFGQGLSFGGSFSGVRQWGVDSYGRLIGQWRYIWRPGENVATCNVPQKDQDVTNILSLPGTNTTYVHYEPVKVGCNGVEETCVCGFYAYYERKDLPQYGASGIIEGYGLAVEGPKGFRSKKAVIKALVLCDNDKLITPINKRAGMGYSDWTNPAIPEQVKENYPDVRFFNSMDEMFAEFPPSDPPLFDPNAPDFWDKPVR